MASDHDTAYKQLFSHPEMVRELLLGYVPGDLLSQLDLSTLERVSGSYVGDKGTQRHSDMVWKVRLDREWLYLYILLEFQSRSDLWMALRMFVYVGLMYQDLVKRHELPESGQLPSVFPIVLYDGAQLWNASKSLTDLIRPPPQGLESLQPAMEYLLIERRRPPADPASGNLIRLLFRAAATQSHQDNVTLLRQVALWLADERNAAMRNSVEFWLRSRLPKPRRMPNMKSRDQLEGENEMLPTVEEVEEYWKYAERLEEAQEFLMRGLVKRFGDAGEAMLDDVVEGNLEQVRIWYDRLLDEMSLDEIFTKE